MLSIRSTPLWHSQDLADETKRFGSSAPRLRANSPTTKSSCASQGRARLPAGTSWGPGSMRKDGRRGCARTSPGLTTWGMGSTWMTGSVSSTCRTSVYANKEWVVPRSIPIIYFASFNRTLLLYRRNNVVASIPRFPLLPGSESSLFPGVQSNVEGQPGVPASHDAGASP